MERLSVRVQQQLCLLRGIGEKEEIQAAKQVLKEAKNSRAVSVVKPSTFLVSVIRIHPSVFST